MKVTDGGGLFSKDTVHITVNAAPINYSCGDTNIPHVNSQLIPVVTLSEARVGMAVASAGNKILFAGGSRLPNSLFSPKVQIYDITTQTTSTANLCGGRYIIAAVAAGNKIFFAGGEVGDGTWPVDSVDIYDVTTDSWSVTHLSTAGHSIATTTVGNKVFFAGGDGGFSGTNRERTVDIYDLNTNTWSKAMLSEDRRGGLAVVAANNKVYFAGGQTFTSNLGWHASKNIDVYDNSTNSWSTSSLIEGKYDFAGIAVNNKIFWSGGLTGTSFSPSCLVEIREINTGNSSTQSLSSAGVGPSVVAKGNKILFFPYRSTGRDTNKFDIYDMATNTWSIGVLPMKVEGVSIISVNNIIYLAGGKVNGVLSNQVWKLEF